MESGYTYLRARYYDPSIGRFISEDPIFDGDNWYAYCGNDPINYIDPSGLSRRPQIVLYVGSHFVVPPARHASLVFFIHQSQVRHLVRNNTALEIPRGSIVPITGRPRGGWRSNGYRYFTIGAGASDGFRSGFVRAGFNRDRDRNLHLRSQKYRRIGNITAFRMNVLIRRTDAYRRRHSSAPRYHMDPIGRRGAYNSNSYITGLLRASNLRRRKPEGIHPGWYKPIPRSYYRL